MDYTYFDKECYHHIDELDNLEKYDLFISMFVDSDRVKVPYSRIKAKNELWITISEDQNAKFLKDKNLLILHDSPTLTPSKSAQIKTVAYQQVNLYFG